MLQLAYILDGTDGEIARFRNQCSYLGEYLDRVFHVFIYPLIYISLGLGLFLMKKHDVIILIPTFFSSFFLIQLWLINNDFAIIAHKRKILVNSENKKENRKIKKILLLDPLSPATLMNLLLLFAIIDKISLFLYFMSFALFARYIYQLFINYRVMSLQYWIKEKR